MNRCEYNEKTQEYTYFGLSDDELDEKVQEYMLLHNSTDYANAYKKVLDKLEQSIHDKEDRANKQKFYEQNAKDYEKSLESEIDRENEIWDNIEKHSRNLSTEQKCKIVQNLVKYEKLTGNKDSEMLLLSHNNDVAKFLNFTVKQVEGEGMKTYISSFGDQE